MKYNDLDLKNWQELDINTDSLWIISQRDKTGKHKNGYHGNFISNSKSTYTKIYKKRRYYFRAIYGSGMTLFECEKLNRKYIGFDINPTIFIM